MLTITNAKIPMAIAPIESITQVRQGQVMRTILGFFRWLIPHGC